MRCRRCAERAVINMPQHKLALCSDHYLEWFVERTQATLRKYRMVTPEDRILVAVSGGKDSLALWDVLLRLGLAADGVYIDLGIPEYSAQSRQKVLAFAESHPGTRAHVVDLRALYGASVPELAARRRGDNRTCSVCGIVKRHEMNRIAQEAGYTVLATGHNLDDEAAVLFGNVLHWQTGYLARQYPVLPGDEDGFARKIKPFCRFYEREVAAYTLLRGIDYIYEECPFAVGATSLQHKALLNQLEHQAPGAKLQFYINFLRARQKGEIVFVESPASRPALAPCRQCGQPTSAGDLCAFCRLWASGDQKSAAP